VRRNIAADRRARGGRDARIEAGVNDFPQDHDAHIFQGRLLPFRFVG
jgi:hypothetical protein